MISGIYLKNYKCYQKTIFVPVFNTGSNFVIYLGDNGVGKSAILEALNNFFSKKPNWSRNRDSKKGATESFVAPIFWIKKDRKVEIKKEYFNKLEKALKMSISGSFPLCIARKETGELTLFDGTRELTDAEHQQLAKKFYEKISKQYKLLYLGAEVNIDENVRINSEISEIILGSSIVSEVKKKIQESDSKTRLLDNLNDILEKLIDQKFTAKLKEIDKRYSYGSSKGSLANITTQILARVSTEAYLYSRKLKFDGKSIENLSSGQRRTALLDYIKSLAESRSITSENLILAIDEPEISLDASRKMAQFEKLIALSELGIPVLATSHWYGWIAGASKGTSVLICDKDGSKTIKSFDNGDFPFRDMPKFEMRMIFDFLMSLGASAENTPTTKFLICEGPTDVNYLTSSLKNETYKIFAVGKERVKAFADIFKGYHWKKSGTEIKNVAFIIDTDTDQKDKYDNNYLYRWVKDDERVPDLVSDGSYFFNKCEIEDVLEPKEYLDSIKKCIIGDAFVDSLQIKYPDMSGVDAFGLDRVNLRKLDKLLEIHKKKISEEYSRIMLTRDGGNLIKMLIEKII